MLIVDAVMLIECSLDLIGSLVKEIQKKVWDLK